MSGEPLLPQSPGLAILVAALATAIGVGSCAWSVAAMLRAATLQHGQRLDQLTRVDLVQLFVFVDPAQFLRLNLSLLMLLPAMAFLLSGSPLLTGLLFAALLLAPSVAYRSLRERRRRRLLEQLPDVTASIGAALRAGLSLRQALEQIPQLQPRPISQEFALALRQQRLGLPLEQGLQELADRARAHEFRMFASSLALASDLGGGLAEALERLGSSVRRRVAMEARIRSLTAQGRLQGIIVGALPFVLIAVLLVMQPEAMRPLFATPSGWVVLGLVVALELSGWMLIRRIVRIDV